MIRAGSRAIGLNLNRTWPFRERCPLRGIRQKELKEFNAEEKDLLQSISSLKSAVTVLGKKAAFAQVMQKHEALLSGVFTHTQRKAVTAFIQAPSYAPQGGEIFGILQQMKETFESNLASSQKEENGSQKAS